MKGITNCWEIRYTLVWGFFMLLAVSASGSEAVGTSGSAGGGISGGISGGTSGGISANCAVASNFLTTAQQLAKAYNQVSGHRVILSFGSTGSLYAQIRNGAPFDLLLAADSDTPERLEKDELGIAGSRYTYALGKLVLWSNNASIVDQYGKVLQQPKNYKLAIANPDLAPYGLAAMELLNSIELQHLWQDKLILGNSVAQVHQFVISGNVQLGLVAASQVFADNQLIRGSAWVIPAQLYQPIKQQAILLKHGAGNVAAKGFLAYLQSPAGIAIILRSGYAVR